MATNDKFDEYYFDSLSSVGKEFFSEFLSELTRKRQTAVLISAFIAILVSFTLVSPTETDVAGIKFSFINSSVINPLAGVVCVYFLLVYVISVLQDLELHRYRTMPFLFRQEQIAHRVENEIKERERRLAELRRIFDEKWKDRQELLDRAEAIRLKYKPQTDELEAKLESFNPISEHLGDTAKTLRQLQDIDRKSWQAQLKFYDFMHEYAKQDGVNELSKEIISSIKDVKLNDKSELILKTRQRYLLYNRLRLIIEIVFPIGLSLFAIGSVIWVVFIK